MYLLVDSVIVLNGVTNCLGFQLELLNLLSLLRDLLFNLIDGNLNIISCCDCNRFGSSLQALQLPFESLNYLVVVLTFTITNLVDLLRRNSILHSLDSLKPNLVDVFSDIAVYLQQLLS